MTTEAKKLRGGRYVVTGPTGFGFGTFTRLRDAEKCLERLEAATSIIWLGTYADGTPGREHVKFAND